MKPLASYSLATALAVASAPALSAACNISLTNFATNFHATSTTTFDDRVQATGADGTALVASTAMV